MKFMIFKKNYLKDKIEKQKKIKKLKGDLEINTNE